MKLKAELEGETRTIEIKREGTRVFAEIDGRRYEVEARATGPSVYLLLNEGNVYDCRVDQPAGMPDTHEVTVNNHTYSIVLTDPKRLRSGGSSLTHTAGSAQIVAPMPGKVVRVLVEAGVDVVAGAGIVVVEAMKMQNELKSPKSGRISAINVEAGVTVNAGQILAIID